MRRLGQHFLRSADVARKMARAIAPEAGETIIEIGGGHGELTQELAFRFEVLGVSDTRLIVIEKDVRLAQELRKRFSGNKAVSIVEGDARKILPSITQNLKPKTCKICGNLPYYLTGFLLRQISELEHKPISCVFMVQKEVAERMAAKPPRMNKLAASVQFWSRPKILFSVPRESFSPPPKVESAVIKLETVPVSCGPEHYFRLVKSLFAQPRQTILNNLLRGFKDLDKSKLAEALEKTGLAANSRPQDASVEQIALLSGKLF